MEKYLFYVEDNMAFFANKDIDSFEILDMEFDEDEELKDFEDDVELIMFEVDLKNIIQDYEDLDQRNSQIQEAFDEGMPWIVGENKNGEYLQIFTGTEKSEFITLIERSGGTIYKEP